MPDLDPEAELKLLRSMAIGFIVGVRRTLVDGARAFDPAQDILMEWYQEFGQYDPHVVAEMQAPIEGLRNNRQQRRQHARRSASVGVQ